MDEDIIIPLALGLLAILAVTPVATVVLLVRQSRLTARIEALETALGAALGRVAGPAPALMPQPLMVEPPPLPAGPPPLPAGPPPLPVVAPPLPTEAAARIAARGPDWLDALGIWLRANWVFALAAVSLALAGVFFVQYGIENGLLPPPVRVAAALGFGLLLIAAGEWIRRRGGDGAEAPGLHLPSVLSSAGIVSVYAGVVAGRLLYGLYGPGVTLAGLVATTLGAVLLGWRHGPFLVAMGLVGAGAAPFLVAGGGGATAALYPYYLLLALLGLAVDAFRRWGWVSVLALLVGGGGALLMRLGGAGPEGWALSALGFVALAVVVPGRAPVPEQAPPSTTEALLGGGTPGFPVRLALGTVLVASVALAVTVEGMWSLGSLAALALGLVVLTARAPGFGDLAILPAAAFLTRLWTDAPLAADFAAQAIPLRAPESAAPVTVSVLLALAAALSLALALRARGALLRPLALAAVMVAPVAAALLEFRWIPAPVLGELPWALHVMAVAALATWLAARWAPLEDRRPMAWAVLAALSSVALALFLLLDAAALTLAFGVLAVAAAWLDRRLRLVEMGWFLQAGIAAISYRLVADPGLDWAGGAPLWQVLAAFGGASAAALAARHLLPDLRRTERAVTESAAAVWVALLADVLLRRGFPQPDPVDAAGVHWLLVLRALPWLAIAAAQLWRMGAGGRVDLLRRIVAAAAAAMAALPLGLVLTAANPLVAEDRGRILGWPLLDSLALGYGLPGALLVAGARGLPGLGRGRKPLLGAGLLFLATWVVLEIRRLWHGPRIDLGEVLQGELYSYTLALLILGAALLWLAVQRRSELLRRAAMVTIGVTVAKVFLWDAAGLQGLVRVLSFACLGLVLAGMAWINGLVRRAMAAQGRM